MKAPSRRVVLGVLAVLLFTTGLAVSFVLVARANDMTPGALYHHLRYSVSQIGKTPRPAPSPGATRDERWRQDLAYLASELPRLHANAFHTTPRKAFRSAVADLDARIPELTDAEITVELMRIVALVGDGHTGTWTWTERFRRFPIALRWIDDEMVVIAAGENHEQLLGARVVRVGHASVGDALGMVRELTSFDSDGDFHARAARMLTHTEILHALRLQDEDDRSTWMLASQEGEEIEVDLAAEEGDAQMAWTASVPVPPFRARADEDFWWRSMPDEGMVYLKVHRCRDREGFREVAAEVLRAVDSAPASHLVVDLRGNGGGDESVLAPLLAGIEERQLGSAGRLWVLTDAGTYSSATGNTASLRSLGARSAGEPTGDGLDGYGEVRRFMLANSGIDVVYSTRYWRRSGSEEPLQPDVVVRPSIEDVLAGRDPVLERVAADIRSRPSAAVR